MKKFWIGSALAMVAIIALGFALNYANQVKACKDYLILIGDSYVHMRDTKSEYLAMSDSDSDLAKTKQELYKSWASGTLYLIHTMEETHDPEMITKCLHKLSLSEMENLSSAFDYYEENIDIVTEVYGTPKPHQ